MTNAELKEALFSCEPVIYQKITYTCVSAIIYRKGQGNRVNISAELFDVNGNSVTIAPAALVKKHG